MMIKNKFYWLFASSALLTLSLTSVRVKADNLKDNSSDTREIQKNNINNLMDSHNQNEKIIYTTSDKQNSTNDSLSTDTSNIDDTVNVDTSSNEQNNTNVNDIDSSSTSTSTTNTASTTKIASTISELTDYVNNATEDTTISLSSDFPTDTTSTIVLNENTKYAITIDGQNKTLSTTLGNTILSYNTGSASSDDGGNLTIKNLNFDGLGSNSQGIFLDKVVGNFTLYNCDIKDFHYGTGGGGLEISPNSKANISIDNCTFSDNTLDWEGYYGGAIVAKSFGGKFTSNNSIYKDNATLALGTGIAGGEGGAICFFNPTASASFIFKDNYFEGNKAVENAYSLTSGKSTLADGGAIAFFNVVQGAYVQFEGNTFNKNIAGDNGGAILIQTNSTITSGIVFKNNTFFANVANEPYRFGFGTKSGGPFKYMLMVHQIMDGFLQ